MSFGKSLSDFPPGMAAKRYRSTPEQIERNIRGNEIQRERDERAWKKALEKIKERSQGQSPENQESTPK